MAKTYNDSYIYSKFPYEEGIFRFLMTAERINKDGKNFEDIKYEFKKRQIDNALLKILLSKNVYLLTGRDGTPLNRQFRVLCSKDPKEKSANSKDYKIFIDCTGLIVLDKSGDYKCRNIDILISHIINAMVCMIYHKAENQILTAHLVANTMEAFINLFTQVIDHMLKISVIPSSKIKCQIIAGAYFVNNILNQDLSQSNKALIKKITNVSDRELESVLNQCNTESLSSLPTAIALVASILKFPSLKTENVIDKWMYLYGSNTIFALEYYPALSAMLTDAYCGAYINNQKTIEKVVGNTLVEYTKNVITKGGSLI